MYEARFAPAFSLRAESPSGQGAGHGSGVVAEQPVVVVAVAVAERGAWAAASVGQAWITA